MARSYFSTTIDVPLEEVWAVARDFNGLATWWSGSVSASQIEDGKTGDTVGAIRRFTFGTDQMGPRSGRYCGSAAWTSAAMLTRWHWMWSGCG